MEEHKQRYLKDFLRRTKTSLEDLIEFVKEREGKLRSCYAEPFKFGSDEFAEIILVDTSFIMEVFLRHNDPNTRNESDHIFNHPYLIEDIWYDMWLLENQLAFFIIEDLFNQLPGKNLTIIELTYEYFKSFDAVNGKLNKVKSAKKIEHFTDFLRICHLPLTLRQTQSQRKTNTTTAPSVMQLHQAGVRFRLSSSKELFDIKFRNGTLEIPQLKLQMETESLFRNLIAFEQRHYSENYINDYVFTIHHFVSTPKEVELHVQNGIIDNWLPNTEDAWTLINDFSRGVTLFPSQFYYSGVFQELNAYCKSFISMSRATLVKNNIMSSAVLVIILTIIQVLLSILQVLYSFPDKRA